MALAACCRLAVQNDSPCGLGIYIAKPKFIPGGFAKANSVSVLFGVISFAMDFFICSLKMLCFEYVISNVFQTAVGLLSVLSFCNFSL